MKIKARESEQLMAASPSATAELGGLPDPEQIRAERNAQMLAKVADAYGVPRDELRKFCEDY